MIKIDENMKFGDFKRLIKGHQCKLIFKDCTSMYIDPNEEINHDVFASVDRVEILDQNNYSHYFKDVSHLQSIDVYRVLDLFKVTDPCAQHSIKKLLCAGNRGDKDFKKDITEARDSMNRLLQMLEENSNNC